MKREDLWCLGVVLLIAIWAIGMVGLVWLALNQ
jgi:hypothetical protein